MTRKRDTRAAVVRAAMAAYRRYGDWYKARYEIGVLSADDKMWSLMKACARHAAAGKRKGVKRG